MNSSAPADPSATRTPVYDLPAVAFFGRSLAEYCQFFALDPADWRDRAVLDVAAGPASFTAEAHRLGVDAVAVDSVYEYAPAVLGERVRHDYEHMFRRMREPGNRRRFRLRSFRSIDEAERDRRAAAQRFLHDFAVHRMHGRYYGGALPQLPFLNDSFDLVLCAHLLFLYPLQFDFDFHVAAGIELMRVAREEVRIHPVCGPDGRAYPELTRLFGAWAAAGIDAREVPVDYEFFAGGASMLVLTRMHA